jgi:hypothetical protein
MSAVPRYPTVAVLGLGACSAIGFGVRPIQAAMAAGLRNFTDAGLIAGKEPARYSVLPGLADTADRAERITALTRAALADLLSDEQTAGVAGNVSVFIGLAHEAPDSDLDAIGRVLTQQAPGLIDPNQARSLRAYRAGRVAFLTALAKAVQAFDRGDCELGLLIGVDTRCTWSLMEGLIRERRLLTEQDDGSIPAEGAVVALVAPANSRWAARARMLIAGPAFGEDEFEALRQAPQASAGLGNAFQALRQHPLAIESRPQAIVAFETGELFFTRAFATGYLRSPQLMPEPLRHELIASNVGDTGAAAAGMALLRADGMMRRPGAARGQRILIYGHADDGRCAAAMAIGS